MILYDVGNTEAHPAYQKLQIENVARQYGFLKSIVEASLLVERPFLSQAVIKSLNFHAVTCLHGSAGVYRPCEVSVGAHTPPQYFRLGGLMDDFINQMNRHWDATDAVVLASMVLWRLNYIHPFENGNGRTARAACLFILCVKAGGWLPGAPVLPELIKRERDRYVEALRQADESFHGGELDLAALHALLSELVEEQLGS